MNILLWLEIIRRLQLLRQRVKKKLSAKYEAQVKIRRDGDAKENGND